MSDSLKQKAIDKLKNKLEFGFCMFDEIYQNFDAVSFIKSQSDKLLKNSNMNIKDFSNYIFMILDRFQKIIFNIFKKFEFLMPSDDQFLNYKDKCSNFLEESFLIKFIHQISIDKSMNDKNSLKITKKKGILMNNFIRKSLFFKTSNQFLFQRENIKLKSFSGNNELVKIRHINLMDDDLEIEFLIDTQKIVLNKYFGQIEISSKKMIYIYDIKIDFTNLQIISVFPKSYNHYLSEFFVYIFVIFVIFYYLFNLGKNIIILKNEFEIFFIINDFDIGKKNKSVKIKKYTRKIFDNSYKKICKILSNLKNYLLVLEFVFNKETITKKKTQDSKKHFLQFSFWKEIKCLKMQKSFFKNLQSHTHCFNHKEIIKSLVLDKKISDIKFKKDSRPEILFNVLKNLFLLNQKTKFRYLFSNENNNKVLKKSEISIKLQRRKISLNNQKEKKEFSDNQSTKYKKNQMKKSKITKNKIFENNSKKNNHFKKIIYLKNPFFKKINEKDFFYNGYPLFDENNFVEEESSMIEIDLLDTKIKKIERNDDDKILHTNPYIKVFEKYQKELTPPNNMYKFSDEEIYLPNFMFYDKEKNKFKKYLKRLRKKNTDFELNQVVIFSPKSSDEDIKTNFDENLSEVKKSNGLNDNSWIGYFQQSDKLNATISKMNETQSFSIEKNLVDLMDQPFLNIKNQDDERPIRRKTKIKLKNKIFASDEENYILEEKSNIRSKSENKLNEVFKHFKANKIKNTEDFYGLPEKISEEESSQEDISEYIKSFSNSNYQNILKDQPIIESQIVKKKILDDSEMNPNNIPFINPNTFESSQSSEDKLNTTKKSRSEQSYYQKSENELFKHFQSNNEQYNNSDNDDESCLAFRLNNSSSSKNSLKISNNDLYFSEYCRNKNQKMTQVQNWPNSHYFPTNFSMPSYPQQQINPWLIRPNNQLDEIDIHDSYSSKQTKKKSQKLKERIKNKPNKDMLQNNQFMLNYQSNLFQHSNLMMRKEPGQMFVQQNSSYPYPNINPNINQNIVNPYSAIPIPFVYNNLNHVPKNIYDHYNKNVQKIVKETRKKKANTKVKKKKIPLKKKRNSFEKEKKEKVIAIDSSDGKFETEEITSSFSRKSILEIEKKDLDFEPKTKNLNTNKNILFHSNEELNSLKRINKEMERYPNLSPMNNYLDFENENHLHQYKKKNNEINFSHQESELWKRNSLLEKMFIEEENRNVLNSKRNENIFSNSETLFREDIDVNNNSSSGYKFDKYLDFIYKDEEEQEDDVCSSEKSSSKMKSFDENLNEKNEFNCFLNRRESKSQIEHYLSGVGKNQLPLSVMERIKSRKDKSNKSIKFNFEQ